MIKDTIRYDQIKSEQTKSDQFSAMPTARDVLVEPSDLILSCDL